MEKRNEYRSIKFETRVEEKQEGGKKLVLRGYAILFNTETVVHDFWGGEIRETIEPTALDNTDLTDVYLISGHNIEPIHVLGRTGRNLRLEKDETGLFFECELPNTQEARDIYNLVEMEIVDGMSFGFDSDDEIDYETHTRTIKDIKRLYEISITPFPAYELTCVVARKERELDEDKDQEDEKKELEAEETERAKREAEEAEKQKLEQEIAEKTKELEDLEKLLEDEENKDE